MFSKYFFKNLNHRKKMIEHEHFSSLQEHVDHSGKMGKSFLEFSEHSGFSRSGLS